MEHSPYLQVRLRITPEVLRGFWKGSRHCVNKYFLFTIHSRWKYQTCRAITCMPAFTTQKYLQKITAR